MGFLNPFLYLTGAPAFDVMSGGRNPGCWTPDGFQAAIVQWDQYSHVYRCRTCIACDWTAHA